MDSREILIRDFYSSFHKMDVEATKVFLHEDFVFQNGPQSKVEGRDKFLTEIEGWWGYYPTDPGWDLIVRHVGLDGDNAIVVRDDYMACHNTPLSGPHGCMCSVKIKDGKIIYWRDYFDRVSWIESMGESLANPTDSLPVGATVGSSH